MKYIFLIDDGDPVDIAGHARQLNGDWKPFRNEDGDAPADVAGWIREHHRLAKEFLDISEEQAKQLFPSFLPLGGEITPQDASRVLMHFAETGVIDWKVCRQ